MQTEIGMVRTSANPPGLSHAIVSSQAGAPTDGTRAGFVRVTFTGLGDD